VKYADILKFNKAYFDDVYERKFLGDVLGYVTPVSIYYFYLLVKCCIIYYISEFKLSRKANGGRIPDKCVLFVFYYEIFTIIDIFMFL